MNGRRVMPNADGWLPDFQPGDYGRATSPLIHPGSLVGAWNVCTPDGHHGTLSPELHQVEEHEDGTITVTPSIDMSKRIKGAYHGYLRRGVWVP